MSSRCQFKHRCLDLLPTLAKCLGNWNCVQISGLKWRIPAVWSPLWQDKIPHTAPRNRQGWSFSAMRHSAGSQNFKLKVRDRLPVKCYQFWPIKSGDYVRGSKLTEKEDLIGAGITEHDFYYQCPVMEIWTLKESVWSTQRKPVILKQSGNFKFMLISELDFQSVKEWLSRCSGAHERRNTLSSSWVDVTSVFFFFFFFDVP